MGTRYFTKGVFDFLKELKQNNNKAWWEDNKQRYIDVIREPALDFIEDFGKEIDKISPNYMSDTRVNGGSLMRPYRDVRFSKDKTPYKTNVGIHFRHKRGKDVHAPGFYLHIEPGSNFAGVGLWTPEAKVAQKIRQQINDDPASWKKAAHSKRFSDVWRIDGGGAEHLKRVPSGFSEDHPYPDDLRLKSFTAGTNLTQASITSDQFGKELSSDFRRAAGYMSFLNGAVGLEF